MFLPLKNILSSAVRQKGLNKKIEAVLVLEEAQKILEQIFGSKIINKAKPIYLKNNVLVIAVLSSVVSQELKLRENEIVGKVNKKFGREIVRNLKFLV